MAHFAFSIRLADTEEPEMQMAPRALIKGDQQANTLTGGSSDDVIYGYGGNDTIDYGGGNNTVYGGDGSDTISGDSSAGKNLLYGGGGNDSITGADNVDKIYGGSGNDRLFGWGGNDRLHGEDGNDEIFGGSGDDYLSGGAGNDRLDGGGGDNDIYGEAGDDLISGSYGADVIDGGSGVDWVYYSLSLYAVRVSLAKHTAFGGDAQGDRLSNVEGLFGSTFDDELTGDAGNNLLNGGYGGSDRLSGGRGDDTYTWYVWSSGQDAIYEWQNSGNDRLDVQFLSPTQSTAPALFFSRSGNDVIVEAEGYSGHSITLKNQLLANCGIESLVIGDRTYGRDEINAAAKSGRSLLSASHRTFASW